MNKKTEKVEDNNKKVNQLKKAIIQKKRKQKKIF